MLGTLSETSWFLRRLMLLLLQRSVCTQQLSFHNLQCWIMSSKHHSSSMGFWDSQAVTGLTAGVCVTMKGQTVPDLPKGYKIVGLKCSYWSYLLHVSSPALCILLHSNQPAHICFLLKYGSEILWDSKHSAGIASQKENIFLFLFFLCNKQGMLTKPETKYILRWN